MPPPTGWEPRPSLWLLATSGRNFLGDLHDEAAPHHGALLVCPLWMGHLNHMYNRPSMCGCECGCRCNGS